MIYEVTGMPGVGKSTFLHRCEEQCPGEFVIFSDQALDGRLWLPFLGGVLGKIINQLILLLYGLGGGKKAWRLLVYVVRALKELDESLFVKINILRNAILKIGRHRFIERRMSDENVMIDEGLVHLAFNISDYSDRKQDVDTVGLLELISAFTGNAVLVIYDPAVEESIQDRLEAKQHKRVVRYTSEEKERFTNINRRVIISIRECVRQGRYFGSVIDLRCDESMAPEELMKMVGAR